LPVKDWFFAIDGDHDVMDGDAIPGSRKPESALDALGGAYKVGFGELCKYLGKILVRDPLKFRQISYAHILHRKIP